MLRNIRMTSDLRSSSDVLFLQSGKSAAAIEVICQVMERRSMFNGTDFIITGNPTLLEELVYNNRPQLVFIGLVYDEKNQMITNEIVRCLRAKNDKLVCIGLSTMPDFLDSSLFEGILDKNTDPFSWPLHRVMEEFWHRRLFRGRPSVVCEMAAVIKKNPLVPA